jgi:mRNA-degrading endonuclease YafQ of YafQ-DinJ toxin-antitoxin module
MKDLLTERFQRDVAALDSDQRRSLFDSILALPRAVGDPHAHAGLGIRKLHPSGIWEARVGLGLRVVFGIQPDLLALVRVGTHDDIRRFLKQL